MSGLFRRRVVVAGFVVLLSLIGVLPALAATVTRGSAASITIADAGAASPYPATIDVGGLYGGITDVNVTLSGLSHEASTDITVLLVGPFGQSVVLMDDAGGDSGRATSNITLTFDDAAPTTLPQDIDGALFSGTFKPTPAPATPYGCNDIPAPASTPAGPYGTTLSVFNGTNPNGIWSLYVYDDCAFGTGAIEGGWSLQIAALGPAVTVPSDITIPNDPGQAGAVVHYTATGVDHFNNPLPPACTPGSGSFFPIGTTTVSCMVTDDRGREAIDTFTVTVNDVEPPVLSLPGDIEVPATGPDGAVVTYTATATDNSGNATVTCTPPSGSTFSIGATTVNCSATDASNLSDSGGFTVTIVEAPASPSDLLEQLRADTITLVVDSMMERLLVAYVDSARSTLDRGSTWLTRYALLQYDYQLRFGVLIRRISLTAGEQLHAEVIEILDALE